MSDDGLTKQEALARILRGKEEQRRKLACLSFEEKFQIVLQMQALSRQARSAVVPPR